MPAAAGNVGHPSRFPMNAISAQTFSVPAFTRAGGFSARVSRRCRPRSTAIRAAVHPRYGGPDTVTLVATPIPQPADGQLRIRVQSAALNPLDWKLLRGDLKFLRSRAWPKGVGRDFAGLVDAVGEGVAGWRRGEPVFGSLARPLTNVRGAVSECVIVSPAEIVRRPTGLRAAAAAALPMAGASALELLRLAEVTAGASVLVVGAAGGVGSYVTAFGSRRGARVTAVCREANADYARSLGAHRVVARDRTAPLELAEEFDAIIDTVGAWPFSRWAQRLKPCGVHVTTASGAGHALASVWSRLRGGRRTRALMIAVTPAHLAELARLSPEVAEHVALTHYPLEKISAALRHSQSGTARGKLIIDVGVTAG